MTVNQKAIFARLVQFDLERLDRLAALVSDGVDRELDVLLALAGDEDEGIEFYADEAGEVSGISTIFSQLAVVGIYAIVELRTKSLLRHHLTRAKVSKTYEFETLKTFFRQTTGKEPSTVDSYSEVDELRCLNNAIKHSGVVGAALAAFPGWALGTEIGSVAKPYSRYRAAVPKYLNGMSAVLL